MRGESAGCDGWTRLREIFVMRINILLPFYSGLPIGGFKVQYEYANRLAQRGHAVTVVHPCTVEAPKSWKARIAHQAKSVLDQTVDQSTVKWHSVRDDVSLMSVPDLREKFLPAADATLATSWATAEMMKDYSPRTGRKYQIVYDYEIWMTADAEMRGRMSESFAGGQNVIATSCAVSEMLAACGVPAVGCVQCGVDFETFGIDVPVEQRRWGTIGFPVREQPSKGTTDALEALKIVRSRHGDSLEIAAFGPKRVQGLPDWVRPAWYPSNVDLRRFYNSIAIFVFPSHFEGWGLPGVEALACGAALVAADSVGARHYAIDQQTALVVPRARPDLLAVAIESLLNDEALRRRLARAGNAHVQQYTWSRAVDALESLLASEQEVVTV